MSVRDFWKRRKEENERVFRHAPLPLKRFFSLDGQAYRDGALSRKTKELLGLACSLVLRCDDCVRYHLIQARRLGCTTEEVMEALTVASVVGGTITIPHLRRAVAAWEELLGMDVDAELPE